MRVSRGILGLTVALAVAPVGIGFAHGGGSMGGGGPTGSAAGSLSSAISDILLLRQRPLSYRSNPFEPHNLRAPPYRERYTKSDGVTTLLYGEVR